MSFNSPPQPATTPASSKPYKVMVVDDSAVIRGIIVRTLANDPQIDVIATASNGRKAIEELKKTPVDVIVLDIEMPEMDGLQALPYLLKQDPQVKIIMASTLTLRNADISLKAMSLGASDYVPKPTSATDAMNSTNFKHDLVEKVKNLAIAKQQRSRPMGASTATSSVPSIYNAGSSKDNIRLRPMPKRAPAIWLIGSSTGGPQALLKVLKNIKGVFKQPIVITQHMPPRFTTVLAEHLARESGCICIEATHGQALQGGHVYVAPGDYHMTLAKNGAQVVLALDQNPPENYCRPAVDPLFRSAASVYGAQAYGIILTGMGADGQKGAASLVEAGGAIFAQDAASSVVWGMPGAVATTGLCSAVLPIDEIQPLMRKFI